MREQTRVALYMRVATGDQVSIENQWRSLERFAQRNSLTVVARCADTGSCFDDRPGLRNALSAIQTGRATALLAKSKDRLHRDYSEFYKIKEQVCQCGGNIFFSDDLQGVGL